MAIGKGDFLDSNGSFFDENQIVVLVLPDKDYIERVISVVSDLEKTPKKMCYVSLNRPYRSLQSTFKQAGIDSDGIFFIDAITATATAPEKSPNCVFVSSPGALTELSVTISNVMESGPYNLIFFDSLSTLLVYESDNTIAKFVHFLMAKVRVTGKNAIFTCLKQDADSMLVKDINMFADKVLDVEKW
jgi:archaellum biogenesis ATPase FlaH